MAEQFETILKDAFSYFGEFEAESQIETTDAKLAVRTLNRMMARYVREGIDLNYTDVDSLDDYLTVPDAALDGIVKNLALNLSPHYVEAGPSAALIGLAKSGKRSLMVLGKTPIKLEYPSSLPQGSGNYEDIYAYDNFYPDSIPHPIFWLEQTGSTVTISAANTPTKISSGWSERTVRGFTHDESSGKAVFDKVDRFFKVQVNLKATVASGTDNCSFYIYRNGEQRPMSIVTKSLTAGTYSTINLTWIVQLKTEDYIEIYCENDDEAVNIVIDQDGDFRIE